MAARAPRPSAGGVKRTVANSSRRRPVARKRRRGPRTPVALGRFALAWCALAALVLFVPPLRDAFMTARSVLIEAIAESRRAELRRLATARYALSYGVSLQLASEIEHAAIAEGIDPELGFRLVRVESEFREDAVSSAGAIGLTQLMPATAASLQPGITREEIFVRRTNLHLGFRYLRWLLSVYDGDVREALHAYNRGPGTVDRLRALGEDPANGYAERILRAPGTPRYTGNGLVR